jgi:hypothetical protein
MVAPQKIYRNTNETCFLTFTSIFKTMGDKEKYRGTPSVLKVPVVYFTTGNKSSHKSLIVEKYIFQVGAMKD